MSLRSVQRNILADVGPTATTVGMVSASCPANSFAARRSQRSQSAGIGLACADSETQPKRDAIDEPAQMGRRLDDAGGHQHLRNRLGLLQSRTLDTNGEDGALASSAA